MINICLSFEIFLTGFSKKVDNFLKISPILAKKIIFIGIPIKATIIVNILPSSKVGVKFP